MTALIYLLSSVLLLAILLHAISSIMKSRKRSLGWDGEILRNFASRQERFAFNLKVIKKELFFRKIKYVLEIIIGFMALVIISIMVGLAIYGIKL